MLEEQILYLLEKNKGQTVTGGELAKELSVSRTAVWKAIGKLREKGNQIQSLPNSGYRLDKTSDGLSRQYIQDLLKTRYLGKDLVVLETVSSTNQYLKEQPTGSIPEGYAVIANQQTQGRGRFGRTFYSPAGSGIYLSLLLRPPIPINEVSFLTICAAVAVSDAIQEVCGIQVGIKWVNDLLYHGKKLCGILTEASISAEIQAIDYAIVGIGVNLGEVAPEVEDIATSLYAISGRQGLRNQLIAEILNQFEKVYLGFTQEGKKAQILSAYVEKLCNVGKPVEILAPDRSYQAVIQGVDQTGALLVQTQTGETITVSTGEIKL